jgi:hypothetical protein
MKSLVARGLLFFCCNLMPNPVLTQQSKFLNVDRPNQASGDIRSQGYRGGHRRNIDEHPANFEQRIHGSFHNPNRSMNHHANSIRKQRGGLHQLAGCLLVDEMANGLATICVYNCHGHQYSLQTDNTNICAQTVSEKSLGN